MFNKLGLYFTVRDGFGDNVAEAQYLSFDAAADALKEFCAKPGVDAEGAFLGVVYKGEDRDYKCALVQNHVTPLGNRFRSMYNNISERALAVPQIELAALRARQLEHPFDEKTQQRIDELEKQLGVFDREVITFNDLRIGKWRVHIVPPGGRYGFNNNLVNKDPESSIEFWDMSVNAASFPDGQFVTRYSLDSLYDSKWGPGPDMIMRGGLCLDGSNADVWSVTADEMKQVFAWLKSRELLPGENFIAASGDVDVPFDKEDNIPLPHMGGNVMSGEVILHQKLDGLACVRDLHVEEMGVYKNGVGYSVSFNSQATQDQVQRELEKLLAEMPHSFEFEQCSVAKEKEPLDKIISSCEELSKDGNMGNDRERGDFMDMEER